jgi:mono/diheme cytochrome c family protein
MVRWRWFRPLVGVALLVLLSGGPVGPLAVLHAVAVHLTSCPVPPAGEHDSLGQGGAGASARPFHCAACHGLASNRALLTARPAWPGVPAPAGRVRAIVVPTGSQGALPDVPARAPPVAA